MSEQKIRTEKIEINLLLEALFQRYGYDFRSYAPASIERRIRQFCSKAGCQSISEMIPRLLHDENFFSRMVRYFSVAVTEMFRDPLMYLALRGEVIPRLKSWPHVKIWHAGCATGEEVYSLAILLKEEGLYERTTIYATDFNVEVLEVARSGIYLTRNLQQATRNYQLSGGKRSFSEYYQAGSEVAAIDSTLKDRLVFSSHNLATDNVFGEMHLILCRNVLIYFNRELQNRALGLFTESLVRGGFLCLGSKETLQFSDCGEKYDVVDAKGRIYKKRVQS